MDAQTLGSRQFTQDDQVSFAALSGDHNPMHMDAVLARRTQAGAPVVHGIHTALTGIELAAPSLPTARPLASVEAVFNKMVYVGDLVDYRLKISNEKTAAIEAVIGGVAVTRIRLTFGEPPAAGFQIEAAAPAINPQSAIDLAFEQIAGQTGHVRAPASTADIIAAFPGACRLWQPERIAAILATTFLVGMVCPGLHSIFGGFTLHAAAPEAGALGFRVAAADARFRMVRLQVRGGGVHGTVDSVARTPPVSQAGLAELSGLCHADEFAGATALIIGGSRGLGELTAKLLALGGAKVIITYSTGQADAEKLAREIRGNGGACDVMPYDFRSPAAAQLSQLPAGVTQLYYFATPQIFRRKSGLFDRQRYAEFQHCYVTAFYELFELLYAASPAGLAAFYPSSVAVSERPREMTEYTMAKAAGEVLCADIAAFLPKARVLVSRLPRLPTDQTATVRIVETADPVAVMLPLIRQVQHAAAAGGQ
jgi:acyl dehydratase/NAD(P)-dependent dehydrogenase (short-subunit alcohol dehydrogenase family)